MPDAGRVIAGTARSIRLDAPGPGTRPLGDRVKQTLFAILEPELPGARFLDLFAGSGAAGIEALSRGAAHATFVERDAPAAPGHRGQPRPDPPRRAGPGHGRARGRRSAGCASRSAPASRRWDVVLLDPPYDDTAALSATLLERRPARRPGRPGRGQALLARRAAGPGGLLASDRERRFGETALTFYRREEDA